MSRNLLVQETSPYLLQHKDNPVHWRPWGPEALAEAQRDRKPILLSIGYSACHWCHVMAHESFENDSIAAVMNELFVNIKVDREERPDLDVIYQSALALMGEHGGWPLTMFLTSHGDPFWGGTYFPASPRFGRPAFPDVLRRVAELHRTEGEKIAQNVSAIRQALGKLAQPAGGDGLSGEALDSAARGALRLVDPIHGGTLGAPKFPQPSFFKFLWRAYKRTGSRVFREAVTTTLDAICQGGIYDHVGGGFARYSTDEHWLVPHFEKMLYDNALLIELMAEVWQDTGSPLYAIRVRETIDWALRDMRVVPGENAVGDSTPDLFAFASAFDADSEGVEGKYYVWSEEEIDSVLGADAPVFKEIYGVHSRGNWEGVNILNRSSFDGVSDDEREALLLRCRQKLLDVRGRRIPPLRDDKVLADWNGLMIAALAHAAMIFDEPAWLEAAKAAFTFVSRYMTEEGRLRHTWREGRLRHAAVLDDYANMARASLLLFEATGEAAYLDQAQAWVATANKRYWDGLSGGYFLTADDTDDVITRPKTIADNATPNGNGTMMEVLARLHYLTGTPAYRERAETLGQIFSGKSPEHHTNLPTLCNGFELLENAMQIVVVGDEHQETTGSLTRVAVEAAPPTRIIYRLTPDAQLPDGHPAQGKGLVNGMPAVYLCLGQTCGLPVTDPEDLRRQLAHL